MRRREAGRPRARRALPSLLLAAASAALLSLAAGGGGRGGALQRSLGRIAGGLRDALESLPSAPNYTEYRPEAEYRSRGAEFRPGGMAGLYNVTAAFERWVTPDDILVDGLINVKSGKLALEGDVSVSHLFAYYWGLVAVCAFLVLAVVLFPLCGFCVCCCRCCCGKCGSRARPAGKGKDVCRKVTGGVALIVLATALLFCVVCAFGSNQQLQNGLNEFGDNMETSVNDVDTFLESVTNETQHLLVNNYVEFADVFKDTLQNSTFAVMEKLEDYSNATAMMDLLKFTNNLPLISDSIEELKVGTNALRVYASQLNDAMRKVKKDLITTLQNCKLSQCDDFRDKISKLQTQVDFNMLPDMTEELATLESIDVAGIQAAASKGNDSLAELKQQINDTLRDALDQTSAAIDTGAKTINDTLGDIKKTVVDVRSSLKDGAQPHIDQARDFLAEYGPYVNYVGMAIGAVMLAVAVCLAFGLVCGVCGKRPDGYTDNCCNKGAGARFLICAVTLMFLSGAVIALLALLLFAGGTAVDRTACAFLKDPSSSPRIASVVDSLDLSFNVTFTTVLSNCRRNLSAYHTFNLSSLIDIDEVQRKFDVDQYLDKLDVSNIVNDSFVILDANSKKKLEELKDIELSAHSERFKDELAQDFLNADLNELTTQLRNLIREAEQSPDPEMQKIVGDLQLSLLHLDTYNEKILEPMKKRATEVVDTASTLDDQLKMNKGSFNEAIDDLLEEITEAEKTLQTYGKEMLQNITDEFVDTVKSQVNSYLYRVGNHTKNDIGKCGPLSEVLDATIVNTCDKIVTSLNGLWFSYICAIILFIVTIFVSIAVASLYQKYKQYGQYVETEYLYDAYAEHGDAVPLNSRGKHRPPKKKGKKKGKRYEERGAVMGASGDAVARDYGPQGPTDARYADMAPKHWEDFPNGGPPQYQRAPMEYERPPPYYYPPGTEGAAPPPS